MVPLVDNSPQEDPLVVPVADSSNVFVVDSSVDPNNNEFLNVPIVVQHVSDVSADTASVVPSLNNLGENINVVSETAGSIFDVSGNVNSSFVPIEPAIDVILPNISLKFVEPKVPLPDVVIDVKDIFPPIISLDREDMLEHSVNLAFTNQATTYFFFTNFENHQSTSSPDPSQSVDVSSASSDSFDDNVTISVLRKSQRQSSRLKTKRSGLPF